MKARATQNRTKFILTPMLLLLVTFLALTFANDSVEVQVGGVIVSNPVPTDYASFSFEVTGVLRFTGRSPAAPKQSFVQLLDNLKMASKGNRGPQLRVGGNSADESWWDPEGKPKPHGITYDISPVDIISVNNLARAVNGTIVFDLNFRQANSPDWAVNHMRAIVQHVGFDNVEAVEIGNEPDLYDHNGIRTSSFKLSDFISQSQMYQKALVAIPGVPQKIVQGWVVCCESSWWRQNGQYLDAMKDKLRTISWHRYPLSHCGGHEVTMKELLEDAASIGQAKMYSPYVAQAIRAGVPFVIGEGNSVSCGGMPGVSDRYGATLWAIDFMLNMALVNVSRINFHGGGTGPYTAIAYSSDDATIPDVRPLYYGMLTFATSTAGNAAFTTNQVKSSNPLIKVFTLTRSSSWVVVVIHKDMDATQDADVSVSLPSGRGGTASLGIVSAKDVYASDGLKIFGQTFDGTQNGKPMGSQVFDSVKPDGSGAYRFTLKRFNVAVLEIPK